MSVEWWQILLAIVASIFVWRVTATFDVTQWLENRHERRKKALRVLCPHVTVEMADDNIEILGTLVSPPGTFQAICQRCGMVFPGGIEVAERILRTWMNDPEALLRQEEMFRKKAAKVYKL